MRSVISKAYVPENGESCVSSVVCGHRDSVKRGCGHFLTDHGRSHRSSRKKGRPRLAGGCLSLLLRMLVKIRTITVTT